MPYDVETVYTENIYLRMFSKRVSRPNARTAFLATQHYRAAMMALEWEVEQAALWLALSEAYGRYVVDKLAAEGIHRQALARKCDRCGEPLDPNECGPDHIDCLMGGVPLKVKSCL